MRRPEEGIEDMANASAMRQEDIEMSVSAPYAGVANAVVSRTSIILGWG